MKSHKNISSYNLNVINKPVFLNYILIGSRYLIFIINILIYLIYKNIIHYYHIYPQPHYHFPHSPMILSIHPRTHINSYTLYIYIQKKRKKKKIQQKHMEENSAREEKIRKQKKKIQKKEKDIKQ